MALSNLEILKININEDLYPYYTDEQLEKILEACEGNILLASYRACLGKAATEKRITVGPITLENDESTFWLTLANKFLDEYEASQQSAKGGRYINHMNRLDEV